MATKKQKRAARESSLFLLMAAGVLVLLNVLGVFFFVRVDTTEADLFSLSEGSRRLVANLEDRMEIRAYFSEDLPAPHNATERYVRDLLAEYEQASNGQLKVTFINPDTPEEKEAAERDGINKVRDPSIEQDSFSVKEGYRGLSFHYLGETRAIAQVDSTAGLEYEVTQSIKQMVGERSKVGLLGGHEGPTTSEGLASVSAFLPTYTIEEVKADKPLPDDLKALLIVQPATPLSETELRHIDQYLMKGGSVGIFGGGMKVSLGQGPPKAEAFDSGLNQLLERWGVSLQSNIIADELCGRTRLPSRLGVPIAVPYPPVPIAVLEEDQREHPVAFRLKQVGLPFPSGIALTDELEGDEQVTRTVLMETSDRAWVLEGDEIDLEARRRWDIPGKRGKHVLGVALKGKLPSAFAEPVSSADPNQGSNIEAPARADKSARVLVIGTGLVLRDEFLPRPPQAGTNARPPSGTAAAFALNAIDWLAQDTDLMAIRAKRVEEPTLEVPRKVLEAQAAARAAVEEQDQQKMEAAKEQHKQAVAQQATKKAAYRWGNMVGLPLLVAVAGVIRWRYRKVKRERRTL